MAGISTVIDKHATLALLARPDGCGVDAPRTKSALRIILSGSPMYGDRLAAAKLIQNDECERPECCGCRCTAEHWCFACPTNQANILKHEAEMAAIRDKAVRIRPSNGVVVDRLAQLQCLRSCGICPHPHTDLPQFSWQGEYDDDLKGLHERLLANRPGADFDDLGKFCWLSDGDKQFVKCFTDGSCLFPTDPYLTVGGWGSWC